MKIALAADHGGFDMKEILGARLRQAGHDVTDFGASTPDPADDYPDYIIPLARAVAAGEVDRGIVICGSGVGASVAANKVKGIRAGLCHDHYSVRQGVEDDDMNVLCLGGRVMGIEVAWDHAQTFIAATFSGAWPRWLDSKSHPRRPGEPFGWRSGRYTWFTSPRMAEDRRPGAGRARGQGRAVGAPARPATEPVPGSPEQTVYGLAAQIWAHMSTLVGCPKLVVLRTGCPIVFAHTFCLTAQGLDGDPVYLLDEVLCHRFKLFQDGGGFMKLSAGR
jgi:ribose 5-phosphate isomerase B